MKSVALTIVIAGLAIAQNAMANGNPEQGAVIGYSCLGCHGIDSYRNAYPSFRVPRLGGQKRAYIESSLHAYKSGTRRHPTMMAQAGSLSEDDIANVAAWLETFGAVKDQATAESVSAVPPATTCVACHGEAGDGVTPQPPTLSGQQQDYIVYALTQYKTGKRPGTVMSAFAASLSDENMEAIATYYSSQPGLFTPRAEKD